MKWILSIITCIFSGIISGIIANWLYEKQLRKFLNEIQERIKNLPDELHRQALIKDFEEGNLPKIIDNEEIKYSIKEVNKIRNGENKGISNDIRNKITTGNPANESRMWRFKNWFKKHFKIADKKSSKK